MTKFYAGVGSRRTPFKIQIDMETLAERLHKLDYVLRSGHAHGADRAFERGTDRHEIFLPSDGNIPTAAYRLAESVHPRWDLCSEYARACHARNCMQILGRTLDQPVDFVVCWTPCGSETEAETSVETGGTATAIRLADRRGIKIFNLLKPDAMDRLNALLNHE